VRLDTISRDIRKVVSMVAAMATVSGPAASLAALTDVSEDVGGWLRTYDGYRGVFVFADQDAKTSRVITLWETAEDERAARQARGAMRDQLMAMAGLEVVSFDVYDVHGHEYVGG
jgi:heme-degrading monooxygenase HmoA